MKELRRSLRVQLAVLGFLAIALPVVVLLGVSASTEATVVVDGQRITEGATSERSPWVVWTAVALAPVAALLAWQLAGRAVRPIERIRRVAAGLEPTDLSARIDLVAGPTEVVALAHSFDRMLDRVEQAVEAQQRLVDEASHELRTPLTVLRTNAEVLLAHPDPTPADHRLGLERTRAAAVRLQATVDELLVDARSRTRAVDGRDVDLSALARGVADDLRPVAVDRRVTIDVHGPDVVRATVDGPMVGRALANLVLNAVEWSPPGASVTVTVAPDHDGLALTVTDEGPGLAAEHLEAAFDRGWQADPTRAGAGLGLTIARHIADAHGGSLTAGPSGPSGGATFVLRLPAPTPLPPS